MSRLKDKRIKRSIEKRGVKECLAFEKVACWERKRREWEREKDRSKKAERNSKRMGVEQKE
jgi:hypothetical protein